MTVLFMILSINLDSLVTGFAYGIRRVKIPLFSAAVISALSVCYSGAAMLFGAALTAVLPSVFCRCIGSALLIIIGILVILNAFRNASEGTTSSPQKGGTLFNLVIKSFGITISVVRDPSLCDFDQSKKIDAGEALYLSLALSADAIGVGLGCAMSGIIHTFIPPLIGISQLALLYIGLNTGRFMSNSFHINKRICGIISGTLLIIIAALRMIK